MRLTFRHIGVLYNPWVAQSNLDRKGTMRIKRHTQSIWTIENFLSQQECQGLIALSEERGYDEAQVNVSGIQTTLKTVRNNSRLFYEDKSLAQNYWQRLKPFSPVVGGITPIGLNELFRFYKYTTTQRFKRHRDGSFIRDNNECSKVTFLIYLNDDYKGGETWFKDTTITPKTGMALCFYHELWHEGFEIKAGTKYALRSDIMYGKNE